MSYNEMSLEQFLGHSPNSGGRTRYLTKWKKRRPAEVNIWLHTRAPFAAVWQHNVPMVRQFENKETHVKERAIWSTAFNCFEHEAVLKQQYKLDDYQERIAPPQICPICKMIDHVRLLVRDGQLGLADFLFQIDLEEKQPPEQRLISVGGFINAFRDADKLSDEDKKAVRAAGIRIGGDDGAWRDNAFAKCNYAFALVDHDNPSDGVQVATEGTALGDAMKRAIANQMKRHGTELGHPYKNPYAFQWIHRPNEKEFGKKYDVIDMPRLQLTEDIRQLIVDEEPPDLAYVCRPGDARNLRTQFETYCLIEMPWDEIFSAAEAQQAKAAEKDADTSFDYGANEGESAAEPPAEPAPEPAPQPAARTRVQVPAKLAPAAAAAPAPVRPAQRPAAQPAPTRPAAAAPARQAAAPAARPAAPAPARPAAAAPARTAPAAASPKPAPAAAPKPTARVAPPPVRQRAAPAAPAAPAEPAPYEGADAIPCDDCGFGMHPEETECKKCGAKYNPDASPPEAEQAPGTDNPDGPANGEEGDNITW